MDANLSGKFGFCGLLCEKCYAFKDGPISHDAKQLKSDLGEFDNYAKRFVTLLENPVFSKYPDFKELLNLFAEGSCEGCRKQECQLYKFCNVKQCAKDKGLDYCFQCNEFPCDKTGFDENLRLRWVNINQIIRDIGLENYYLGIKNKSRY